MIGTGIVDNSSVEDVLRKLFLLVAVIVLAGFYGNAANAMTDEHKAKNVELRQAMVEENQHSVYLSLQQTEYLKDEEVRKIESAPYIRDGKTYIPVSVLEDIFSDSVDWILEDHSFLFMWKGSVLKVSLNENKIYYGGKEMSEISADIDMEKGVALPLGEILNTLEIPFQWIGETASIFIYGVEKDILSEKAKKEKKVTENDVMASYLKHLEEEAQKAANPYGKSILEVASSRLGMPYVMGAAGPNRFDCSGFVHWVFTTSGARSYQRGSSQSLYALCQPISREELQVGDLLFFTRTYSSKVPITHSAIYIGNGQMIHAAGNRVQITPLSDGYWTRHFYAYGRMK